MGEVLFSKYLSDNHIVCKILLESQEAISLKSASRNIHIFSPELCKHDAKIIERGRKNSTKYFDIPFNLRFRKKKAHEIISYQKLENHTKIFYIYTINKMELL
jgi:hypothetical protein